MNRVIDIDKLIAGDRRTIARAVSHVENEVAGSERLLSDLFVHTGKAYRIGITGPPGAGKSTLTNKLALHYRSQGRRVAVIAVDPTSPFTGGALLGDRIRMTEAESDDGIFIRSMASRGSLGGLSRTTREAADVFDAAGFEVIFLETVGVGQSELDIAAAADTTVVVLVPESGDGIQAMKAGLMEIADFFVMNKSDRPGADQAVMSIKMILGFRPHDERSWLPGIVKTVAQEGKGIAEVAAMIERHRAYLSSSGDFDRRRRSQLQRRIEEIIQKRFVSDFWNPTRTTHLQNGIPTVMARERSPYQFADDLLSM